MNKKIIFLILIIILPLAYWLISPLFITKEVSENISDIVDNSTRLKTQTQPETVKQGSFTGRLGHSGEGGVSLIRFDNKYYIRLEDDFRVTNGPDLFVYFGKDDKYATEGQVGALKGNVGGQNYQIPSNIDPLSYNEVWIWCRAFSVPFAKAELK